MGQAYAGVLGPLACTLVLARGVISGGGLEATVQMACIALFGFAALGWMAGQLANHLVSESVRLQFETALKNVESHQEKTQPQ